MLCRDISMLTSTEKYSVMLGEPSWGKIMFKQRLHLFLWSHLHEDEKYFDGNHGVVLDQVWELGGGETKARDHLRIALKFGQKSLLLAKRQCALLKYNCEAAKVRFMIYLACSLCELSCFSAPLLLLKQAERKIQCRMLNWWVRLVFTAFRGSNLSQTFIASIFVTRPDIEYTMTCTQVNIMNLIIIYTPVIIFVCNVGVVNRVLPDHLILPGSKRWSLIGRG